MMHAFCKSPRPSPLRSISPQACTWLSEADSASAFTHGLGVKHHSWKITTASASSILTVTLPERPSGHWRLSLRISQTLPWSLRCDFIQLRLVVVWEDEVLWGHLTNPSGIAWAKAIPWGWPKEEEQPEMWWGCFLPKEEELMRAKKGLLLG